MNLIDPGLWVRRSSPWGQARIAGLFRIAYRVLRIASAEAAEILLDKDYELIFFFG